MNPRLDYARAYMHTLPLAISGQGGHNATFYAACELIRRFAVNGEELLLLMREYNEKLAEKWIDQDLRHKVTDAFKKMQETHRPTSPTARRKTWFKPLRTMATLDRIEWEVVPRPRPIPSTQ